MTGFSVATGTGSPSDSPGLNRWFKPEVDAPSSLRSIQIEEKAMKDLKRFYSSVKIVKNQSQEGHLPLLQLELRLFFVFFRPFSFLSFFFLFIQSSAVKSGFIVDLYIQLFCLHSSQIFFSHQFLAFLFFPSHQIHFRYVLVLCKLENSFSSCCFCYRCMNYFFTN